MATAKKSPNQKDDFKSVARRLGASEDKAQFEAMLGKIARAKPATKMAAAKRRKK